MDSLLEYVSGRSADIPQRVISAIDVMLMQGPSESKSFFPRGNSLYSQTVSDRIGGMVRAHQGVSSLRKNNLIDLSSFILVPVLVKEVFL
jgi:hypothetical protein